MWTSRFIGLFVCVASVWAEPVKYSRASGSVIRTKGKIQTGSSSRIEVELPYSAIVRVGSNAKLEFSADYRDMTLDSGTMMASVPKGAGDVIITAGPVATALSGGGDLEMSNVGGSAKVVVLNGKVVASLTKNPSEAKKLRFGQMVDVKAGATSMPPVMAFKMATLLKTSVLFNMGDFPGKRAIKQNATKQAPPGLPFFVTGGFDPDWGGSGGGGSLLSSIGPAGTAAMISRIEQGRPIIPPVLVPGAVPTQAQIVEFEAVEVTIPRSNQQALQQNQGKPAEVSGRPPVVVQPTPPVVVQPTPPPRPTPRPFPTRPPVVAPPIASPRPTFRPPIAVP